MSDHHDAHDGAPKVHPDQHDNDRRITYFATTHTRGKREMFGIRAQDRGKHVYVIGKTGMGKSTMLENMAIQDIQNGEGIAFIDPHGSTAEKLLDFVPQDRIKDVVYFAPFDTEFPLGFNIMEDVGYDKRHLVVSGLIGAFKRIWVDAWSARMEYILQNTLLALLEYPGSTILDVNRMLTNKTFRDAVIEKVTDPIVKDFWQIEFAGFTDTYTREATPAIQNKVGAFVSNPLIRNIVGQPESSFDMRKIMDEKKIFIVNLSKGRMGETNASLLGSMLTVKIYLAAMSRADEPVARMNMLPRFYFYVDEFQSMMNEAFADILSESRKYKLALTLANQYIEQMEEEVRDAVFGNVGTLICFRVGPFDAEVLETVFKPTFLPEDLIGLGIGQIYLTLMIDGVGSAPFSAETIAPIETPSITYRDDVVVHSRDAYGRLRADVESMINKKQQEFVPPPREKKASKSAYGSRPRESAPTPGREPREVLAASIAAARAAAPAPLRTERARDEKPSWTPRVDVQPSRAQKEAEERNSLRAAIERARTESTRNAPVNVTVNVVNSMPRSPVDILREKREKKETQKQAQREPQPEPRQRIHESTPPQQKEQHAERSHTAERDHQSGEVSHATLQQILNDGPADGIRR